MHFILLRLARCIMCLHFFFFFPFRPAASLTDQCSTAPTRPNGYRRRLSLFVQQYTLYGHVRPFGSSLILGGFTPGAHSRPEIYMVDPSGLSYGYYAIAVGKGQLPAKTELEKLGLAGMTCAQAVPHLARIIMGVHDDVKDKPYELEMGWVTEETGRVYQQVPADIVTAAREQARREREEAEMEDDDDE
jgi:20S proteasome subunit alpha 7